MGTSESKQYVSRVISSRGKPIQYTGSDGIVVKPPYGLREVEFDIEPFGQGTFREAYRGKVRMPRGKIAPDGFSVHNGSLVCVVKKFKRGTPFKTEDWAPDLKSISIASGLASAFNTWVENDAKRSADFLQFLGFKRLARLKFAPAFVYEVSKRGSKYDIAETYRKCHGIKSLWSGPTLVNSEKQSPSFAKVTVEERVLVEPYLRGDFVKLNSNTGWWYQLLGDASIAQAFSHWSWCETNGDLLVCDIQGVKIENEDEWMLTDPAIHSSKNSGEYGIADMGKQGINQFFVHHVCNDLCKHLDRPSTLIETELQPMRRTRFSMENPQVSASVHEQKGGTCYANAAATVLRAAEGRIIGRALEGHEIAVARIVAKHGEDGGSVKTVLNEECPSKSLRWKQVQLSEAEDAVRFGRPVVLTFHLTDMHHETEKARSPLPLVDEWSVFADFFDGRRKGVLTAQDFLDGCCFEVGMSVMVRDRESQSWNSGQVTKTVPLQVRLDGWPKDFASTWKYVKRCPDSIRGKKRHELSAKARTGHAVVIVGQEGAVWKVKNSWGSGWANDGYFKIAKDAWPNGSLVEYLDVFFLESDLSDLDKQNAKSADRGIADFKTWTMQPLPQTSTCELPTIHE